MLRDIARGDPAAEAAAQVIAGVAPDVILLQGVDWDLDLLTLKALRGLIAEAGHDFPFLFAARPNSGWATGLDLDGDGRRGGPGDAQGYGRYPGDGGMAVLSRHPIGQVSDLSGALWAGFDWAALPREGGKLFPSEAALEVQRLSSVGHWIVPVELAGETVTLMAFHAGPPVFDGPEDRNGKRNHDEIMLWRHLMDGAPGPAPERRFVILGDANLDPADGEGRREAIRALLDDPRLRDGEPRSAGAELAADPGQAGDPGLDTVDWRGAEEGGPGNLRVSYVLPSADFELRGGGVFWPPPGASGHEMAVRASRHRLVWLDIGW